jgi:hypothetical protein
VAMDLLEKHYPDEDHILIYDNATTHLKRSDTALSAQNMPKGPSDKFCVERTVIGDDRKPVHTANGTLKKEKIRKWEVFRWQRARVLFCRQPPQIPWLFQRHCHNSQGARFDRFDRTWCKASGMQRLSLFFRSHRLLLLLDSLLSARFPGGRVPFGNSLQITRL